MIIIYIFLLIILLYLLTSFACSPVPLKSMICSLESSSLAPRSRTANRLCLLVPSLFQEMSQMEAQWVAKRSALRCLALQHPEWTQPQLAQACGASVSFVKKWLKRFRETDPNDLKVLFSRSRARHTPPPPPDLHLVQGVIEIRTSPPENLQRIPGPRTILYYLKRDPDLAAQGIAPPRSTRTIWKLLRKLGFILDPSERAHKTLPPCEPLQEVQIDFKDASTVQASPEGKRQHVVEVLNFVDAGTSILRKSLNLMPIFMPKPRLHAVISFLRQYGLPPTFTFDHDPRWVGSSSGRDFPSALRRFLRLAGHPAQSLSTQAARQKLLRRKIPSKLQPGVSPGPSADHLAGSS
jgi:hypothetical protein